MREGECKQIIVTPCFAYSYFEHVYLLIKLVYKNRSTRNISKQLVTNNLKMI